MAAKMYQATVEDGSVLTPPCSRESSPRRRSVHFSTRHPVVLQHKAESAKAMSVVDRQWGVLFTDKGEPTGRLGQVLRGLAKYMMQEEGSAVVLPPARLLKMYKEHELDDELIPFTAIFDCSSHQSLRNLELLYQDLACEYHLIQHQARSTPIIPALTPDGLATWLTAFIRAFPDQESERLSHMLVRMPLETDTSPPERLPKQLSRHLLPARPPSCNRVLCALDDWSRRTRAPRRHQSRSRDESPHARPGGSGRHTRDRSPKTRRARDMAAPGPQPARAESYGFYQGRSGPGPTYLDFLRDRHRNGP